MIIAMGIAMSNYGGRMGPLWILICSRTALIVPVRSDMKRDAGRLKLVS